MAQAIKNTPQQLAENTERMEIPAYKATVPLFGIEYKGSQKPRTNRKESLSSYWMQRNPTPQSHKDLQTLL